MREFDEIFFIRLFFRILVAFTAVAVLFFLFFEINDSVVFQNGEIMAENPQLDVKAPFEAIPESIFVKEGENVKAGDTLMILLNEQLRRDFKGTETLVRSLRTTDSTVSGLIRNAYDRIQNLKKERELTKRTYQDQKEQFANQLKSVKQKVDLNKEQLYKVALEKLMMDSTLFKQQVISKLEMTNSYDNFSKYKSSLLESELTHKQAQSGASSLDNNFLWSQNALDLRVIDLQQRMKELNQQKSQTSKDLENMIRSLNYMREQIKKQFIIAQMDGQVQNLFNVKFSQNFVAKDQLLQIKEFLHPRVEEFADILPAAVGAWLLRTGWASRLVNRLTSKGKVLQTTSLWGFLQLYWLAGLRRWRSKTLRFKREQRRIENWLGQVKEIAHADYALALEVAECPRLVKGYGDTYVLGSSNFERLMQAIPRLLQMVDPAARLRNLREAALADDTGKKLENMLAELNLLPGVKP